MKTLLSPVRKKLLAARKSYSACANLVESRIKSAPLLTATLSEQIVGVGIAADWLRRAAEMQTISFVGEHLNASPWTPSFVETTRFTFAWYAANGIFTRDSLLSLVGVPSNSEFSRFSILFAATGLPPNTISTRETTLHAILNETTSPRLPGLVLPTSVTTLCAVDRKYVPVHTKTKGAAKKIADAVATGNLANLDLPTLVYAFRNWSVHGNALHGSFGGRPKFNTYVEILLETLADVHLAIASHLLGAL